MQIKYKLKVPIFTILQRSRLIAGYAQCCVLLLLANPLPDFCAKRKHIGAFAKLLNFFIKPGSDIEMGLGCYYILA